jgi:hypothetical protein
MFLVNQKLFLTLHPAETGAAVIAAYFKWKRSGKKIETVGKKALRKRGSRA